VVPSLLFAAPHISNVKALGGGPLVLIPYFASGLLYGWAAYRTGSLWLAIGLHWNNNLMGLLLLGTQGDVLKSVAPMQFEAPGLALTIVLTVAQAVVTVAILVPLIARRDKRAAASSRTAD
jgi:membrane protease YdiL (CAAX protease family)